MSQEVKALGGQGQWPWGLRMAPGGGLSTAGVKGYLQSWRLSGGSTALKVTVRSSEEHGERQKGCGNGLRPEGKVFLRRPDFSWSQKVNVCIG